MGAHGDDQSMINAKGLCFLMVATAALIFAGCGGAAPQEEATPTPILSAAVSAKPTYAVQQGPITDEIKFVARIASVQEQDLYFKVDGRVSTVNIQNGDTVTKGQILAELDINDLLNQLAQANITLQTAQTKLTTAQQAVNDQKYQAESALRTAKLRLQQAQIKDPTPNAVISQGNLEKAQDAVQVAQAAYDQKKSRPDIGALPESLNLQKATIDLNIARAQYDLAVQSQDSWKYDIMLLQESVNLAQANLDKLTTAIDPALAQDVAKQQLAVDRLKAQITSSRVISPVDGQVTAVAAIAGKTIAAYKPAVSIASGTALEVLADLVSSQVQALSVGQPCLLTMSNYPSKVFHGTVRRLPSSAYGSSVQEDDPSTRVTILDADVKLQRGEIVRVEAILQQKPSVLWIPPDALRTFQGKDFVLLVDGDAQRRVPVKVGVKTDDRVEIVDGLTAGQIVLGP
jgi:RND family efflux transporter MFP subunit